jgi:hypothetical protein
LLHLGKRESFPEVPLLTNKKQHGIIKRYQGESEQGSYTVSKKANSTSAERKRRTREHILEDLSLHHIQGFVLRCGFTVQPTRADYGYDMCLQTYNDQGEIEDELIWLQLKAGETLDRYLLKKDDCFSFPINVKDYRLWTRAILPVYFILYDARLDEAYWSSMKDDTLPSPKATEKTVQLHVPRHQIVGIQTVLMMRQRKNQLVEEYHQGNKSHEK